MKHQLKILIGNLKKTGTTTLINLFGLTGAFIAFILIMLYVWNEYHFDNFQKNAENIYRVEYKNPNEGKSSVFLLGPTGKTLVDEFSEIEKNTTYMPWGKWGEQTFSYENNSGIQRSYEDYSFADENLTSIFSFDFVRGEKTNPLLNPETTIVNETFARKAWGNDDPIGKQLKVMGTNYTVKGVFKDLPVNSVFTCPIILKIPTHGFIGENRDKWNATNYPQFILVKQGVDITELNQKINNQSIVKSKYKFFDNGQTAATIITRPLSDLRFTKEVSESPMFETNNKMFVDSLFIVGILILLVALINYINLLTANLPMRLKTYNINRIIGGGKWNSAKQIMIETVFIFTISYALAFVIAKFLGQSFSSKILGYNLPFSKNQTVLILASCLGLFSSIIAGIYPALISAKGKPIEMLKRKTKGMNENFRGSLSIFQFTATIALIVASISVMKQVRFMEETDIGFNKSSTMVVRLQKEIRNNFDAFQSQLLSSPHINQIACSRAVPGVAQEWNSFNVNGQTYAAWNWAVDDKYMDMMGFEIVEGRGFLKDSEAENGNFICNETAVKKNNWKVGDKLNEGKLVGIMKDFNMVSLRENIDPFVFRKESEMGNFGVVSIKFNNNNLKEVVAIVKSSFEEFCPEIPFRSYFLDDHLNLLYAKENQQARLITIFGMLSVIVSILGILGLSIFMSQQKIKEIGIRKVNGAKISEVLLMLNKGLIKWVAISFVIATPLAWYAMHKWLENFAYRTELSWWIFALAGLLALGIALLTVSWQSWRAATRNPVEALRYE